MKTQTIEREDFAPAGVIELRRYRLQPGTRETLIKLFDREFIEPQEEAGMRVIAQFRDLDDPDCFVWLRGFEDMEKRRKALGTFYAGPVWARHKHEANGTMVNSDNVLLLRPASAQATLFPVRKTRPPRTAGGDRTGLVIATIAYLAPRKRPILPGFSVSRSNRFLRKPGPRCSLPWFPSDRKTPSRGFRSEKVKPFSSGCRSFPIRNDMPTIWKP
ncbi:NIPSNAP family protein [Roseibium salinum]|uniref:NIPSNAP family protein n=1 Tax=Roseibium salinum TaxID=1604349 RepID=UPI00361CE077